MEYLSSFEPVSGEVASVNSLSEKLNKSFEKDKEDVRKLMNLWNMIDEKTSIQYQYITHPQKKTIEKRDTFGDAILNSRKYSFFARSRNEKYQDTPLPLSYESMLLILTDFTMSQYNVKSGSFIKAILLESKRLGRRITLQEASRLKKILLKKNSESKRNKLTHLWSMLDNDIKIEYTYLLGDSNFTKNATFPDVIGKNIGYITAFLKSRNEKYSDKKLPQGPKGILGACVDCKKDQYIEFSSGPLIKAILLESKRLGRRITLQEASRLKKILLKKNSESENSKIMNLRNAMDDRNVVQYNFGGQSGEARFADIINRKRHYGSFAKARNAKYLDKLLPQSLKTIIGTCIECNVNEYKQLSESGPFINAIILESKRLNRKLTLQEAQKLKLKSLSS